MKYLENNKINSCWQQLLLCGAAAVLAMLRRRLRLCQPGSGAGAG